MSLLLGLVMSLSLISLAKGQSPSLNELSVKINKELPEIYDHATKLVGTTVQDKNFYFHFILRASPEEYKWALPKVKTQVLKTICSGKREKELLLLHKANIIYRYESDKGQSLGEFMITPSHCTKK